MDYSFSKNGINKYTTFIEPFFYCGLKKGNKFPIQLLPKNTFNYFEYTLKKSPKDLTCHLQRIQLALSKNHKNMTFSAICDLFIILGAQGLPLRQRLFTRCKKILDKKQVNILNNYLTSNTLTNELAFLPDSCLFKKKQHEFLQFHNHSIQDTQKYEDMLITADSYIENSQFETALEYLLAQLEHNPENEELALKLIKLYKALNYTDAFFDTYNKFSNHLVTAQHWDGAKEYFLNQQKHKQ